MPATKLFLCLAFLGFASHALASSEESKYILLPAEYSDCALSPDGRYVAIFRQVLDSLERFSKPEGPSVYATRVYILDLSTNNIVLAGPPDKAGKKRDPKDRVDQASWAKDGTLLILSTREVMSVDPATGSPIERFNIHATLRKERALPLPDSLDKPLMFYDINWSHGASVTFYSLFPRTGKIRRFAEPGLVKDVSVSVTPPSGNQALSLRAFTKGTNQGYTWELDEAGDLQVYPLELDPEWKTANTGTSICRNGERVMRRYLEKGDAVSELRLFNYRTNQFVGATVLVKREDLDIASSLLTKASVDRMRQGTATLPFRSIVPESILSLVAQLRGAYPLASVNILNTSADGNILSLSISAQNRPRSYFIFDTKAGKLRKVMEAHPDWAERKLAPGTFVHYQSPIERGGNGVASYLHALNEEADADTIINIAAEPLNDFDWGFSSTSRFLSAEGFNTLQIMIPWNLQIALGRASSPSEIEDAFEQCSDFIDTVLQAAQDQVSLQGKVYYALNGSTAALFPALPNRQGLDPQKAFITNPRFHVDLPNESLARLKNLEIYSLKRFVDPKSWYRLAQQTEPKLKLPVVAIWRENDPWWDQEYGTEEQILSFENYCKEVGIDFELDRWSRGAWRALETWKLRAAITIDIMDKIRGTDSGILEAWH